MLDVTLKKRQGDFLVDISFATPKTGVTALFGRSGAGKTSVINMIAGLSRPDAGHVRVNGRAVFDSTQNIDLPTHKRGLGYVFQERRLFPHMTVKSNLVYGMKRIKPSRQYIEFDPVVELLGISHLLDRRPATLSGGEKQRVAIGRALLASPGLLLMDEPLASLDSRRKAEVLPFIRKLSEQFDLPILYVSHAIEEVTALADNLVYLVQGRTRAAGPADMVAARNDFKTEAGREDPPEGLRPLCFAS